MFVRYQLRKCYLLQYNNKTHIAGNDYNQYKYFITDNKIEFRIYYDNIYILIRIKTDANNTSCSIGIYYGKYYTNMKNTQYYLQSSSEIIHYTLTSVVYYNTIIKLLKDML